MSRLALAFVFPLWAGLVAHGCGGQTETTLDAGTGGSGGTGALTSGGATSGGTGAVAGTGASGGTGAVAGTGASGGTGGIDFTACDGPGTCKLFGNCCGGPCGSGAPLTSFEPVNAAHYSEFLAAMCPPPPSCGLCMPLSYPNYVAFCRSGLCTAVDVQKDTLSACSTDADCRLRGGSACCEVCVSSTRGLVALNKDTSLEAEMCPSGVATGCEACVPIYPADAAAVCDAGHCKVVLGK